RGDAEDLWLSVRRGWPVMGVDRSGAARAGPAPAATSRYAVRVQGGSTRWCVLVSLGWLAPALVQAGNGGHPRTPVVWPEDVACMTVVDRAQSAALHLAYAVPYADVELTPDELPDSRRHQFIAFCDGRSAGVTRPNWLSWVDADTWLAWAEA